MNSFRTYIKQHWLGYLVLSLAWLVFFSPILSGQAVYYLDDLKILYYPIEHAYAQFQQAWELPLWSPVFGFGQPLLAWSQLGFFTPLHIVMRALFIPPLTLLQISVAAYFLIGGIGMYQWFRRRKFSSLACALGASLFIFNGFAIGHLNHVNFYTGTMILPWLLVAIDIFLLRPTWRQGMVISLLAGVIVHSAQPQITLYVLIAAALIGFIQFLAQLRSIPATLTLQTYTIRIVAIIAGAAIVWGLVSALIILPLQEFLPSTERSGDLPISELYEFSYPPYHAITLILPYFFGGHDSYWGAKGFQELAAFVGLTPLFLSGIALVTFSYKEKAGRTWQLITALTLIIGGALIALGKYSFLYVYLVENHILTTLANPGRFVFFITLGITLLAPIGLDTLRQLPSLSRTRRLLSWIIGLLIPAILLTPFFIYISSNPRFYAQFMAIASSHATEWLVVLISVATIIYTAIALYQPALRKAMLFLVTSVTIGTLVSYSWNYNPRTNITEVNLQPELYNHVTAYNKEHITPARLYARPDLLRDSNQVAIGRTDEISPTFAIHQPLTPNQDGLTCIQLPLVTHPTLRGTALFTLRDGPQGNIIRLTSFNTTEVASSKETALCFEPIPDSAHKTYWLSLTSKMNSGLYAVYQTASEQSDNVYFLRKANPTSEQWAASRKLSRLVFTPTYQSKPDLETALLERHINATADTSSGRWIGALSVRWYREFIESFFANDAETPIDGDGIHAISRNRNLLDAAGVTHLAQALPQGSLDTMPSNNFPLVASTAIGAYDARVYTNPQAFPKAYLVPNAVWRSADDEIRFAIKQLPFDPKITAYVSGPTPPNQLPQGNLPSTGTATITTYSPTQVDIDVTTDKEVLLILTDTWTPQWHTFVDNQKTMPLKANSVFRSAIVPAGKHTISFRYNSPATNRGQIASTIGLSVIVLSLLPYQRFKSFVSSSRTTSDPI